MYARRDQVAEAAENTFAWLIEKDSIPEELSPGLKISLRQWLRTGTGVFHITGKPGSGKSTLMKFIDESKVADAQLRKWTVGNHKGLITASCYLWKAAEANSLQNELEGLTRTMLFQILQQRPEITSVIFKNHPRWDPKTFTLVNCVTGSHSTAVTLGRQEILAAFESALAISDYRFFLLIDGLDEMKTSRENDHRQIAERILRWSTHRSGHVKICASSREDRVFIETFHGNQRLKLHAVTSEDIKALVDLKIRRYGYLTSAERQALAATIATQAEGVFLWVVLALDNLVPLFTAEQGIQRLQQQVKDLPEEMSDFLADTLRRIPQCYRKEAWAVFNVRALINGLRIGSHYDLLQYSMLEKCLDGSGWRICEHKELMGAEVAHQAQDFVSRFSGFSSGLLELPGLPKDRPLTQYDAFSKGPIFSHRSVYDFLQDHPDNLSKALAIPAELQRLSAPELVIRSTIQVVNRVSLEVLRSFNRLIGDNTSWNLLPTTVPKDGNQILPLLKMLDEAVLQKQRIILPHQQFNELQWTDLHLDPHTASVFHEALTRGYRPYIDWAQEQGNYPSWITSKEFKAWTVEKVFHDGCIPGGIVECRFGNLVGSFSRTIQKFHEVGWLSYKDHVETDHSLIPHFSPVLDSPLWMHLLVALLVSEGGRVCDTFFENNTKVLIDGVDLDVQFEWWSDYSSRESSSSVPRIHAGDGDVLPKRPRAEWLRRDCEPRDKPHDENGKPRSESDVLRRWLQKCKSRRTFPPDTRFGMTVRMGDDEPQLIQGPQWTDTHDNELLPLFVAMFNKPSGIVTFKEILELWVSKMPQGESSKQLALNWATEARKDRDKRTLSPKVCRDWSKITLLCLGLVLGIFFGWFFQQL